MEAGRRSLLPWLVFGAGTVVIAVVSYALFAPKSVAVPVPDAAGSQAICHALAGALPQSLQGHPRRTTTPQSERTAAWSEPPIVLRCGVERPAALVATSDVYAVSGVDWFAQHLSNGDRFTTSGRQAYVEVTVPNGPDVGVDVLTDLAKAIAATDPVRTDGKL